MLRRPNTAKLVVVLTAASIFAPESSTQGGQRWLSVKSPHFEVFSSASASSTRDLAVELERLNSFFEESKDWGLPKPLPVRVIVFRSEREARRFHGLAAADAYWKDHDRDYLVFGGLENRKNLPIAGPYVALLGAYLGINKVSWLRRGFRTFYSTLWSKDDSIVLGIQPAPALRAARRRSPWLPLSTVLAGQSNTAESIAIGPLTPGLHYAQSWALVHMLHLHPDYAPQLTPFLLAAGRTTDQGAVFDAIYGKPLDDVVTDLTDYIDNRMVSHRYAVRQAVQPSIFQVEPSTEFDRDLALSGLLALAGKTKWAGERLSAMEVAYPDAPAAAEAGAYLSRHEGDLAATEKYFIRAIELGSQNPKLCLDYARLCIEAGNRSEGEKLLRRAIQIRGDYVEARIVLANVLLERGQPEAAMTELRCAQQIEPWLVPLYDDALSAVERRLAGP